MKGLIEDRLLASLKYGAFDGNASEVAVCKSQVNEAIIELRNMRDHIAHCCDGCDTDEIKADRDRLRDGVGRLANGMEFRKYDENTMSALRTLDGFYRGGLQSLLAKEKP